MFSESSDFDEMGDNDYSSSFSSDNDDFFSDDDDESDDGSMGFRANPIPIDFINLHDLPIFEEILD